MRWGAAAGLLAGLGLVAWLLSSHDLAGIPGLLGRAGWGIPVVIGFHVLQLWASAEAWRAATKPLPQRLGPVMFLLLRWIREGVNTMLPVAQIGGEVLGVRLLHRRGVPLPTAIAGTTGDVVAGVLTQLLFTLVGAAVMVVYAGTSRLAEWTLAGAGLALAGAAGVAAALWFGLARLAGRWVLRLAARLGWTREDDAAGVRRLGDALRRLGRNRAGLARSGLLHILSWCLGGAEVYLALHVLGWDVSFAEGLAVEAMGQAIRTIGFLVPAGVGVAEGGWVLACAVYGLPADLALALALLKRLREVAFGLPALAVWQIMEFWQPAAPKQRTPA